MLPAEGLLWLIVKLKGLNSSPWHFVYEVCAQLLPLALLLSNAFSVISKTLLNINVHRNRTGTVAVVVVEVVVVGVGGGRV